MEATITPMTTDPLFIPHPADKTLTLHHQVAQQALEKEPVVALEVLQDQADLQEEPTNKKRH